MKFSSALLGALTITSTLALNLHAPATHADSGPVAQLAARGGSRGSNSGSREGSQGSSGSRRRPTPPREPTDRERYMGYIDSLKKFDDEGGRGSHWTKRDYELSERPTSKSGTSGWYQENSRSPVGVFNGDRLSQHREALDYHYTNYPEHQGMEFRTTAGGSQTSTRRRNALKKYDTLPYQLGREETMPASVERGSKITVYPVSQWERDEQGYMLNGAIDRARSTNQGVYFENTYSTPRGSPQGVPYVGRHDVRGDYLPPAYETNAEGRYQSSYGRRYEGYKKRQISIIQGQEGGAGNPTPANVTTDADVDAFLSAFYTAQANVTDAIWPIIDDLTDGTNSTDIHTVAWAVYQMALPSMSMFSPYMNGLNAFDWIEDQMAQNMSVNSTQYQMAAGYDGYLERLYNDAWANATTAANATGVLDDLNFLGGLTAAFSAQLPSDWNSSNSDPNSVDADYFVAWVAGDSANDTIPTNFNQTIVNEFNNASLSRRAIERRARSAPVTLPKY